MKVRLHAIEPASRANGPGWRAVIWFQGCSLGCPGCFNPDTHAPSGGFDDDTVTLAQRINQSPEWIEGVSVSGGEPLQQPEALLDFVRQIDRTRLSCLLFSGFKLDEIQRFAWGPEILKHVDVLVAGRYQAARGLSGTSSGTARVGRGLLGSSNQVVHLLSNRYSHDHVDAVPSRELVLHRDGTVTITGIRPQRGRSGN